MKEISSQQFNFCFCFFQCRYGDKDEVERCGMPFLGTRHNSALEATPRSTMKISHRAAEGHSFALAIACNSASNRSNSFDPERCSFPYHSFHGRVPIVSRQSPYQVSPLLWYDKTRVKDPEELENFSRGFQWPIKLITSAPNSCHSIDPSIQNIHPTRVRLK